MVINREQLVIYCGVRADGEIIAVWFGAHTAQHARDDITVGFAVAVDLRQEGSHHLLRQQCSNNRWTREPE